MGLLFKRILAVLVAVLLSVLLAGLAEGFAYQHGFWNLTPGLILGRKLFVPDQSLSSFNKSWNFELWIDSSVCFLVICSLFLAFSKLRDGAPK
jgi:hypothetical protein